MRFHFPVIIIDEDFRSENASGLGIRALAKAIEVEGFEVLGITSGAAIATAENLALVEQGVNHDLAAVLDERYQHFHSLLLGIDAGLEHLTNSGLHVHRIRPSVCGLDQPLR